MTKHFMTLKAAPFYRIASGSKIYELRLYDEKRKKIAVGDVIEFTKADGVEKCIAEVIGLHPFESFDELYSKLPLAQCGYSPDELDRASPTDMDEYYSKERQAQYGIVAIELRVKESGTMLECKIVEKAQFSIVGTARKFNEKSSKVEIPKFWQEHMSSPAASDICGTYGACLSDGSPEFTYMIADDYQPWKPIPDYAEVKTVPAATWAVFPCRGAVPTSVHNLTKAIYGEWLPSNGRYKSAGSVEIEYYPQDRSGRDDFFCEIWLPVEKI